MAVSLNTPLNLMALIRITLYPLKGFRYNSGVSIILNYFRFFWLPKCTVMYLEAMIQFKC